MKGLKALFFFPIAVGIILTIVTPWLNRDNPAMEYRIIELPSMPSANGEVRYTIVDLSNTGNKEIKEITWKVALNGEPISFTGFRPPDLVGSHTQEANSVVASLPYLNPGENIRMTIAINGKSSDPTVSARAAGVTATPAEQSNPIILSGSYMLGGLLIGAFLGVVLFVAKRDEIRADAVRETANLYSRDVDILTKAFDAILNRTKIESKAELDSLKHQDFIASVKEESKKRPDDH